MITIRAFHPLMALSAAIVALACSKTGDSSSREERPAATQAAEPKPQPSTAPSPAAIASASSASSGFMIEPTPGPPKCAGVAATISAKAAWDSSGLALDIRLGKPTMSGARFDGATLPFAVEGGRVVDAKYVGDDLTLHFSPWSADTASITFVASLSCAAGHQDVEVTVDVATPRTPGSLAKVSLFERPSFP